MANWNKSMSRKARGGTGLLDGTVTSADLTDLTIANADIAEDTITGNKVAEVADVNTSPGIVVAHRTTVPSGANADTDITIDDKIRVIMCYAIMSGAGTAGATLTLKNGSNAISNAADVSGASDTAVVQITTLDDDYVDIADGGTLRWTSASSGADFAGAECYVIGVKTA